MKKYLISLAKDEKRRELFFTQENSADFQIFTAINTMNEEWQDLAKHFDLNAFEQRYQRKATKGEIGCTLSHLAVFQLIAEDDNIQDDEYALICEDDALFNQDFEKNLQVLNLLNQDIIWVGQSKISHFNDPLLEAEYPLGLKSQLTQIGNSDYYYGYPYRNYFAGTVTYLIKKSMAKKLLNLTALPYWLADDFILFEQQAKADILAVRPLLAIENPVLNSNLEVQRKSQHQGMFKVWLKYPLKKYLAFKRNQNKK